MNVAVLIWVRNEKSVLRPAPLPAGATPAAASAATSGGIDEAPASISLGRA